ncbi:Uncharacterised protein [Acinetobacter haemolyticus]|nr:Uncharacterised protein [Acinetobacter haemolyticus]
MIVRKSYLIIKKNCLTMVSYLNCCFKALQSRKNIFYAKTVHNIIGSLYGI